MTELPDDFQTAPLSAVDPDIARVLDRERHASAIVAPSPRRRRQAAANAAFLSPR